VREKRIVSPPRHRARFSVVSNRIRRGHAGDPSRGILAGDDTWLLQWRLARGWAPYYLFLGFLVHAGRNETILKARPVVEPRARQVRRTRSARGPQTSRVSSVARSRKKKKKETKSGMTWGQVPITKTWEIRLSRMKIPRLIALLLPPGERAGRWTSRTRQSPARFLSLKTLRPSPSMCLTVVVGNNVRVWSRSCNVHRACSRLRFPDHQIWMCECGLVFVRTIHGRDGPGMTIDWMSYSTGSGALWGTISFEIGELIFFISDIIG